MHLLTNLVLLIHFSGSVGERVVDGERTVFAAEID